MRPVTKTVSAAAASTTSLAALQAPASGVALTLVASPSFTYGQTVTLTSGSNLSAINFTIAGLDANGHVISEVLVGPNGNTVSSVNFYQTVTSITPAGTSVSTVSAGNALTAVSAWAPVDSNQAPFSIGLGCVITGTITYSVEHTFDDVYSLTAVPTAFTHAVISGVATNQDGNYSAPIRAVRVKQTAGTGSVTMTIVQGMQP